MPTPAMLRADGGSFKDPAGRVYRLDPGTDSERVVRGLNGPAAEVAERLLAEPFFAELVADGRVVATDPLDPQSHAGAAVLAAGWDAAFEHEAVEFVTWPYEWPFSMLKDAALLQLDVLKNAAANGWTLKDATSYNVQWIGCRPVFIDVPSFEPWPEGDPWRGHRQFCATCLTPLLLTSHLGIDFQPLLRSSLEGIDAEQASRHFYGLRRFKRGVLSHIWFPAKAERKAESRASKQPKPESGSPQPEPGSPQPEPARRQPKTRVLALLDSLERLVGKLSPPGASQERPRRAALSGRDADLEAEQLAAKQAFVARHAAELRPRLTWDLAAGSGAIACSAAEHSGTVVAMGHDPGAVDLLYRRLRSDGPANVVPLVMDLANVSPGQGWAGGERPGLDQRSRPDLVLVLDVVHRMRVAANIPLPLFFDWLRSLDAACIVEFVGREDETFSELLANKTLDYADYGIDSFEAEACSRFAVTDRLELPGGRRELFLLDPGGQ